MAPIRPTVLVVDDDADWALFAELALTLEGFDVLSARGGHEALSLAAKAEPDVVVLDLMLADLDGWEVLRRLCGDGPPPRIPVVVVSGEVEDDVSRRVAEYGGHAFLAKPCRADTLARVVRSASAISPGP